MKNRDEDDTRPEYPSELIRAGERGKYAERYREGTNTSPNSGAVNQALREHLARHSG